MCQKCNDFMDETSAMALGEVYDEAMEALDKICESHATNPFIGSIIAHVESEVDRINMQTMYTTAILSESEEELEAAGLNIAEQIRLIRRQSYLVAFFAGAFAQKRGVNLETFNCDNHCTHEDHDHDGKNIMKDLKPEDFGKQSMN